MVSIVCLEVLSQLQGEPVSSDVEFPFSSDVSILSLSWTFGYFLVRYCATDHLEEGGVLESSDKQCKYKEAPGILSAMSGLIFINIFLFAFWECRCGTIHKHLISFAGQDQSHDK